MIGTSGWSYDHWDGVLYPPGTSQRRRLEVYTSEFSTVELNASFYRWPRASTFAGWRDRLPDGFRMAVKGPRGLTHARRLREPEVWVPRLVEGWRALGDRAAVLLLQLPPDLEGDAEVRGRLDHLLGLLPEEVKVSVELRHPTWVDDDAFALLERHGAAYCVMSGARLPCVLRATAPLVHVRLHGPDPDALYAGSYSDADLAWWADRIREWQGQGHDVLAYFNNDGFGHAVRNARTLTAMLA